MSIASICLKNRIRPRRRGGFTMVELLVVIGIIILLMSILLPAIFAVRRRAEIARTKSDLDTVSIALEEYKKVFYDYPRQADPNKGATPGAPRDRVLAQYLLGPNAEGVRVVGTSGSNTQGGKKWGPYLPPDKFRYGTWRKTDGTEVFDRLLDHNGEEIMYYPRYNNYDIRPGLPATSATSDGYLLGKVQASASSPNVPPIRAMFNKYDGLAAQSTDVNPLPPSAAAVNEHILHTLYMLGDGDDVMSGSNPQNNQIDMAAPKNEILSFKGPFMLVSCGPDHKWGRGTTDGVTFLVKKHSDSDDVYNFGR